jgi:hypothetical protein
LTSCTPVEGLPAMRLRSNTLVFAPDRPTPMPNAPLTWEGDSAASLSAMRLPTTVTERCGRKASWYHDSRVSPTRLPLKRLPTTTTESDAFAFS